MLPYGQLWGSWSAVDSVLNGVTVAANAYSSNSNVIAISAASPNQVLDVEITVWVTYGGTVTGGAAIIYILRDTNGQYESTANDLPFGYPMPCVASQACRRTITISGQEASQFKVCVFNPSGNSSITSVQLYVKQSQGQVG